MISINDLNYSYGKEDLFKGLNIVLKPGRIYGFLGKNGAGKTSLFKLISGLLQVQQGTCEVLQYPSSLRLPSMLHNLFLVPETFYLPAVPINTYLKLHAPLYKGFDHECFDTLLKEYEIDKGQKLRALSYGQQKKLLLAFGLATNCRVMLLDEPTNGLDIPSKRTLRKQLAAAINEERIFIIATHQVREIENIFDTIVIIDNGKILLNSLLADITRKLRVHTVHNLEDCDKCLYYEEIPGGYSVISENQTDGEEQIDLEFLFNAVVSQKGEVGRFLA